MKVVNLVFQVFFLLIAINSICTFFSTFEKALTDHERAR